MNKSLSYLSLIFILTFGEISMAYNDLRTQSAHFSDGKFRNPKVVSKNLWDVIKMRFNSDWASWPEWVEIAQAPTPLQRVMGPEIRVTFINHSTFLIQTNGYNILTDPIFSKRCSPFSFIGPKRVHDPGVPFDKIPKIDFVVISHDHYDHLDLDTINKLRDRDQPKFYMGLGVGERLKTMKNSFEMDWWDKLKVTNDFELSFVPVQHFSGRTLTDRNSTLWGGFVLNIKGKKIYFGGDSGYSDHYLKTQEKMGPMDLSLIPIGAYSPRDFMSYAHVDPKQAVQAHLDLKSKKTIGMHFGTFQLTAEPINEPLELLEVEKKAAGITDQAFITLKPGETYQDNQVFEKLN
jgi:L-ascorbate metabolism protein UlaG (beta-lactamase superfamily)